MAVKRKIYKITLNSLFGSFHEKSAGARVQRWIGVPVIWFTFADVLKVIDTKVNLEAHLWDVFVGFFWAGRAFLVARPLKARAWVRATTALVSHIDVSTHDMFKPPRARSLAASHFLDFRGGVAFLQVVSTECAASCQKHETNFLHSTRMTTYIYCWAFISYMEARLYNEGAKYKTIRHLSAYRFIQSIGFIKN